ncbi:hypothetical protein [Bacillus subtilis]|nr:hypothetical protein [Bacillus subtilis]
MHTTLRVKLSRSGEMKEKLSVQMPSYMIPSYFIQLEKMPLTSNGEN